MHGFEEPTYLAPSAAEGFYVHRFAVPNLPLPPPPPATVAGPAAAEAPPPTARWRALLRFGGVWQSAEVRLNGAPLGRHDSGFTAFAFDVTPHLRPGADNLLAVRVRQNTRDAVFDTNDDWALGGIYRDVWLEFTPPELWIDRVEAVTDFDQDFRDATLTVRAFVGSPGEGERACAVRATLTDAAGREVARAEEAGPLSKWGGRDFILKMPVAAPAAWTAETPNLFGLRVELISRGEAIHRWEDRLGFREVSTAGGVLRVNGRPVKLRGVCRHDQHPDVGRATRREHWLQDLRLMKAANINAVRTAHYPPAEGFVRLCDELGLYVVEEIPTGKLNTRAADPAYAGGAFLRVHETIARDRNRPSIIVWSVGNEDPLGALHVDMVRAVKGLDPTRPTLLAWQAGEELPPEVDLLAPHYWSEQQYEALASRAKRPILSTEYTHSLGPDDGGGMEARWKALTRHPAGAGAFVWLWADQGLVRRPPPGATVHDPFDFAKYSVESSEFIRHRDLGDGRILDAHGIYGADGIVDADRTPQRDYWEVRAVYAPVAVAAEAVTMGPGDIPPPAVKEAWGPPSDPIAQVRIPLRNDHDFLDLAGIVIRWRWMAGAVELAAGETRATIPPRQAGALEIPIRAGLLSPRADSDDGTRDDHFILLSFHRPDGTELIQRGLRVDLPSPEPRREGGPGVPCAVRKLDDGRIAVRAGGIEWTFDPRAGGLAGIAHGDGSPIGACVRPVIGRPPTLSEAALWWRGHRQEPPLPDLDRCETKVTRWTFEERDGAATLGVDAEHRVDDRNGFATGVDYRVQPDGTLAVSFLIRPRVEAGWVPEAGFELELPAGATYLRWLGPGPLAAWPNKKAAATYGLWVNRAEDEGGTKTGIRWAEVTCGAAVLRIEGAAAVRFEAKRPEAGAPKSIRMLSHVAGRNAKFDRPDRPEDRLEVGPDTVFRGQFTLRAWSKTR